MAKVSLRVYNQEIEKLVERGELDEAIAHCRHVLNAFPKNLETYRLLGKAYLESKRYKEATDIFERLLMAVPDDFVAQVGMSIINDEQQNMDAAIWHMERAFEVQPSNAAIQGELQRLYGRRDGVEPPKIRLTRGALAHMYVQGELHPQAISEIKSVLEDDPKRQDMLALLARAYFHSGNKGEAAEICSQLLSRYPYCFDANRVLVELLPQNERTESSQVNRQCINELDPYAHFVTGSVFHSHEVADVAVSLEKLDWDGQPIDMQPNWSDSLGIGKTEGSTSGDEEPDWLKSGLTDDAPIAPTPAEEPAPTLGGLPIPTADSSESEEIPDLLSEVDLSKDQGITMEESSTLEESDDSLSEPIAEGELPNWVQDMAPSGADQENAPLQAEPSEDLTQDDLPDWVQDMASSGADQESASLQTEPSEDLTKDGPDWLQGLGDAQDAVPEEQPQSVEKADLPGWLGSSPGEQMESQEASPELAQETPVAEDAPLSDLNFGEEQPAAEEPAQTVEETAPPAEATAIPDDLVPSAEEQDDGVAWLENLASQHGAKPEELVTDPEARKETAPEWVQKASEAGDEQPAVEEPVQPVKESAAPVEQPQTAEEGDLPDWLASPPIEETKTQEPSQEPAQETPTSADAPLADLNLGEEQPAVEEPVQPVEETTPPVAATSADDLGISAEDQDDGVAWLENLTAQHGAKPEELVTDPEAQKEAAPAWVHNASEAGDEQPAVEELVQPVEEPVPPGAEESAEKPPVEEPAVSEEDWMKNAREVGESLYAELEESQTDEPLLADSDETGMWLNNLDKDAGAEDGQTADQAPETEAGLEPESEADSELSGQDAIEKPAENIDYDDLPSWLEGLDEGTSPEPPASTDDSLPDRLSSESEGEPAQAEPTSPIDWQPTEVAAESAPTEESPVPKVEEPTPEVASVAQAEQDILPESQPGSPSRKPGKLTSSLEPLLVDAQNELNSKNIPAALENYGKLIKKGKMLDEVVYDLREALNRYPVEVSILQTLGDAYMRANRLQDALDSYTKAEELLR